MHRKTDSPSIKEALQARDISDLQKGISDLGKKIDDGFTGVHLRQDTTNGKVLKTQEDITALKAKFQYNRIIWYLLTTAVSMIVALSSYILFKH